MKFLLILINFNDIDNYTVLIDDPKSHHKINPVRCSKRKLELSKFLNKHNLDIATITETWLKPSDNSLNLYNTYRKDRPTISEPRRRGTHRYPQWYSRRPHPPTQTHEHRIFVYQIKAMTLTYHWRSLRTPKNQNN